MVGSWNETCNNMIKANNNSMIIKKQNDKKQNKQKTIINVIFCKITLLTVLTTKQRASLPAMDLTK